jgi:hypothetical protein
VFVYQPGTTTDFTGTAYNAKSGGSSISNGFVTNSQGEAEAWFDTPQSVDIAVTDNSGTAYYPAAPSTLIPFAPITEANWDLEPAREDRATSVGLVGDLTTITNLAQTALAGTTGRWTDAGHRHVKDASSANPHGAADHTDVTKKIFLMPGEAMIDTATNITVATGVSSSGAINYADAATNTASWNFSLPDWASGTLSAQPVWSPSATDGVAHTVRWEYAMKTVGTGADITAAGTTLLWTGASAARTVNLIVYDTDTNTTFTPASNTEPMILTVSRIGADGADTYVGAVRLIGILLTYTASQ